VKRIVSVLVLLALYLLLVVQMDARMHALQPVAKLGFVPNATVTRYLVGDQKTAVAALYSLRGVIYYGEMLQQWRTGNRQTPEMENLFAFLHASVLLDPYNMDNYYFAQAAFTWEVGWAEQVNALLIHGMDYRTWDWLLPYYAGFNAGYFLQDYPAASRYMQRAAEVSGNSLLARLTTRYMQKYGKTGLAIAFLDDMLDRSRDKDLVESLSVRRQALVSLLQIERAVEGYRERYNANPADLQALVASGLIDEIPADPYGGTFYMEDSGEVNSTSLLTFSRRIEESKNDKHSDNHSAE